jgi:tetratricopeptide (TPR) repeat protein
MGLAGYASPARYGRLRELISAFQRALLALVAALALAVAGAAVSAWAFIPAAIAAVGAALDAFLVWGEGEAEREQEIASLLAGHAIRVQDAKAHEFRIDVEALPHGQSWQHIERDLEDELAAAITTALTGAGPRLVMLCGETRAGKTRAALQALRVPALEGAWLVEPRDGACVAKLLCPGALPASWRPLVVWLDDIERYASADASGLHASALRDLRVDRPIVLLATEGGRGQNLYENDSALAEPVEQLRNIANTIKVDVKLSPAELERTKLAYGEEFARESERVGLGRRMVAVGEIRRKLLTGKHANTSEQCREGQAVLGAAIDWRRAGAQSPITTEQLEALYVHRLPDDLDPSPTLFQSGLDWARRVLPNTKISLLPRTPRNPDCFEPHDLAVQVASQEWPKLTGQELGDISNYASASDCFQMANVAYRDQNMAAAEHLISLAERSPDDTLAGSAAHNLAALLYELGRLDEAEAAWRRAEERGHINAAGNLGILFHQQDRLDEAEAAYRRADERDGGAHAAYNLGVLLKEQGRLDEAEAAWRRADEHDHEDAANDLGILLKEQGRLDEAEAAWHRADEHGNMNAAYNLGILLNERGRLDEAEAMLRRADERGNGAAANSLGIILYEQGRLDEAEVAWHRADEHGNMNAAYNLGVLLKERGLLDEAEAAFCRADERGHIDAANNLGVLLKEQGRLDEAEAAWHRADEHGDQDAAYNLGILLYEQGRLDEAEAAWRRADERGNVDAAHNLGVLLEKQGRLDEAEAVSRQAEGHRPDSQ